MQLATQHLSIVGVCFKLILIFIISVSFFSCKKIVTEDVVLKNNDLESTNRDPNTNCDLSTTICEDCYIQEQADEDTSDYTPIILGDTFNNPYSIQNMTAAFNYIYSTSITQVNTTHYYVRVKPNNPEQLNILDSLDVELFDYPLNKKIIQEGDYWPTAYNGIPQNEFPWLYTVVEKNFQFPSNIVHEIIEPLHIPNDHDVLEDEAYYITGNSACDSIEYLPLRAERKEYYRLAPIDPCQFGVLDECAGGGGTGTTSNSGRKPKGNISFKTYSTNSNGRIGATGPLKYIRIVARRFFKIDKTYTDENGNFRLSKSFPKKVTIIVKFKASTAHGQHSIRIGNRNSAVWKTMFPLKKNIGTYKGNNLQNINYEFQKGSSSLKRKTKFWVSAVAFNTTEEYRLFLSEEYIYQLPDDLRIYLYANGDQANVPEYDMIRRSNAPLFNQNRSIITDLGNYGGSSLLGLATIALSIPPSIGGVIFAPPVAAMLLITYFFAVPQYPDINLHYRTADINSLTASKVSFTTAQQLSIAFLNKIEKLSPYAGEGLAEYNFSSQYVTHVYNYDNYRPFGNGMDNATAYRRGLTAIWQCFAQHMGHTVADRLYGTGAQEFNLQGKNWVSDANKSSHAKYLEEFDPTLRAPIDYFGWIPVGLINDLIDSDTDPFPIVDNVSGFTYQEIQTALLGKPSSVNDFKNQLKSLKPGQSLQIDQLFSSYGY